MQVQVDEKVGKLVAEFSNLGFEEKKKLFLWFLDGIKLENSIITKTKDVVNQLDVNQSDMLIDLYKDFLATAELIQGYSALQKSEKLGSIHQKTLQMYNREELEKKQENIDQKLDDILAGF